MAKIDKELKRQLSAAARAEERGTASGRDQPLEAVVHFRAPDGKRVADPEAVQEIARDLLSRVEQRTSETPVAYNVFANLQSMVVQASRTFLVELLAQPEIASALANRSSKATDRE
jgi:hypothetical protein